MVDYVLCKPNMFRKLSNFKVHNISEWSDHCKLSFAFDANVVMQAPENRRDGEMHKFIWDQANVVQLTLGGPGDHNTQFIPGGSCQLDTALGRSTPGPWSACRLVFYFTDHLGAARQQSSSPLALLGGEIMTNTVIRCKYKDHRFYWRLDIKVSTPARRYLESRNKPNKASNWRI